MKLIITFLDGEKLELCDSSIINGYINIEQPDKEFKLEKIFSTSFDAGYTNEASLVATKTPQLGYASLINEVEWISVGSNTDFSTFYKTTSIKSISRKLL
ncbi:MAG: hypothetical protein PWR19_534 [Carnobacterium sp.]|uniref:hypothetical protein n=1 Tax=Carnobacterium TaxID=2747 RepID=UPI00055533EB|nr:MULTISPECIES: hypothetical protein [Carnobacterium]MDN5371488.1 hypothetical protein [Carnobacterium sp.]